MQMFSKFYRMIRSFAFFFFVFFPEFNFFLYYVSCRGRFGQTGCQITGLYLCPLQGPFPMSNFPNFNKKSQFMLDLIWLIFKGKKKCIATLEVLRSKAMSKSKGYLPKWLFYRLNVFLILKISRCNFQSFWSTGVLFPQKVRRRPELWFSKTLDVFFNPSYWQSTAVSRNWPCQKSSPGVSSMTGQNIIKV